jgi:hypothetical protein
MPVTYKLVTRFNLKQIMRKLIVFTGVLFSLFVLSSFIFHINPHKNGDIIFIVNPSGQGKAIQLATKS